MSSDEATVPNIRLNLLAEPEQVALVRELLGAVAEEYRLQEPDVNDIQTAVSEACNNVAQHAYPDEAGPMEVDVQIVEDALEVAVRDRGSGIQRVSPRIDGEDRQTLGIGMMIMKTLSESVEFRTRHHGGIEVRMRFAVPGVHAAPRQVPAAEMDLGNPRCDDTTSTIAVALEPPRLASAVLPRLLSAAAARSHLSTDRLSDLVIVADAIAAHAPQTVAGAQLTVHATMRHRSIQLRVGPLPDGGAEQLLAMAAPPSIARLLQTLSDEHRVDSDRFEREVLVLRIDEHRPLLPPKPA